MEFGEPISNNHYDKHTPVINKILDGVCMNENKERICDENFMRHVGWSKEYSYNPCLSKYFSQETVNKISRQVTQNLQCVGTNNRPIIVTDDVICHNHRGQVSFMNY